MEFVEDDVFFVDLTERISLLIMDDDDPLLNCPPVSFQVLSRTIQPSHNQIPRLHEQNGRREIKGTGVFIPQSSTNRRRRRSNQSRSKSSNPKVQAKRLADTSSGPLPHEPYNNHNTSFNSFNHRNAIDIKW